jgi:hypothetical protein
MKNICFSLLFLLFIYPVSEGYCQNEKIVTLSVSGQGKSLDEAKNIALRSALELAFGTFISSKTEIFNEELIGDEIVSLTSGNIQDFKIVSQAVLPDGSHAVSLIATVSVSNFTSFVESKGIVVEFKGGLFSENIKIQKLNEEAEYKAILNLCEISDNLLKKSLDFKLDIKEPKIAESDADKYELQLIVTAIPNNYFNSFKSYFLETIRNIGMNDSELNNYKKINKAIYTLSVESDLKFENYKGKDKWNPLQLDFYLPAKDFFHDRERAKILEPERKDYFGSYKFIGDLIHFRNPQSSIALQNLFLKSNQYLSSFRINFIGLNTSDSVLAEVSPSLWNLNTSYNEWEESKNTNIGFPNFRFFNDGDGSYLGSTTSWYIYINQESFFSDKDRYIGKINFIRKLYFNERTFHFDLESVEKISSITIEPIN